MGILAGCRTAKMAQTEIVHDSVYRTRDSIVIKYVKDSVSEREKTTILKKHDTVNGTDTTFVIRDHYVDRWRLQVDTVKKVVYIDKSKNTASVNKPAEKTKEQKEKSLALKIFVGLAVVWLIAFIVIKLKK